MNSTDICNRALVMLGMPPIASVDDNSSSATQCRICYPILRDRVLREHTWSFATTYMPLQQLNECSPDPRLRFVCALPGDLIRIIAVHGCGRYRKITHLRLLVEDFPGELVYTKRVADPGEYDATFCEALQYLLASELAMANTRDAQLANFYKQEYERRLALARSTDSIENIDSYQHDRRGTFLRARSGLGTRERPIHPRCRIPEEELVGKENKFPEESAEE